MRKIMVCAVLVFALRTSGQTTTYDTGTGHAQPLIPTAQSKLPNTLLGVVIESWHYDPAQKTLTLHLVNHSNKTVTAFNISMLEKYVDGSTNPWYAEGIPHKLQDGGRMEDELGLLQSQEGRGGGNGVMRVGPVVNGQIAGPPSSVFAAGTTRDYVWMRGEQKEVTDIEAVVDLVAYADGTADVQNDRAFKNLVAARKGPLLAMQKVVEVAKGVLADPMVSSPIADVLKALKPLADAEQRPPEDPEFYQTMYLQNDVRNLEMMQRPQFLSHMKVTEREWLTRYVEQQEKQIAFLAPHANLYVPEPR